MLYVTRHAVDKYKAITGQTSVVLAEHRIRQIVELGREQINTNLIFRKIENGQFKEMYYTHNEFRAVVIENRIVTVEFDYHTRERKAKRQEQRKRYVLKTLKRLNKRKKR